MTIDLNRLRKIGWTEWDPIELLRTRVTWLGQPFQDEYDRYLIHVADRIVAGDSDCELVDYLVSIVDIDMGLGQSEVSKKRASSTVAAIRAYLAEDGR